jgi:hypothetical protein
MGLMLRVKQDNQMLQRHKCVLEGQMDGIFGFKS